MPNKILKSQLIMLMFCFFTLTFAFTQTKEEVIPNTSDAKSQEIKATIKLLENPEELQKIILQLKVISKLQEPPIKETILQPTNNIIVNKTVEERLPFLFLAPFKSIAEKFTSFYSQLEKELQVIPAKINQLKKIIFSKTEINKIPFYRNFVIVAIIIGLAMFFISRLLAKKLKLSYQKTETISFSKNLNKMIILSIIKISPMLLIYLVTLLGIFLIHIPAPIDYVLIRIILALITYTFIQQVFFVFFAPNVNKNRLIPLSDKSAVYTFSWLNRILFFSLIMFILYIINNSLKLFAFAILIVNIYKIGLSFFIIILLTQLRKPTENLLLMVFKKNESLWLNRFKATYNYFLKKLFPLLMLDVLLLMSLSVLDYKPLFSSIFSKTIASIVVFVLAYIIIFLLQFIVNKLQVITKNLKKELPELIMQLNYLIKTLTKLLHVLIFLSCVFIIFEIWGISIYKPLQTNITIIKAIFQILFLILIGFFTFQGSRYLIQKFKQEAINRMGKLRKISKGETEKRATTLASLSQKTVNISIIVIIGMMILTELGIDIKPILGGVGILGLAVGFGAQNLVRDIISGLFLIFEDQIRVGDVAVINGTSGLVEQVNLRITVLRGLDGTVHIFPNGMITSLSNMTHDFSYYLMDISVAYKENIDNVIKVITQLGKEIETDPEYSQFILEPLEILGLDKFSDSAIIIKARIKTVPVQQWLVGREFNRRMKNRFDELGIEIPFPHMTFYFGDKSKPVKIETENHIEEKKLIELLEKDSKIKEKK